MSFALHLGQLEKTKEEAVKHQTNPRPVLAVLSLPMLPSTLAWVVMRVSCPPFLTTLGCPCPFLHQGFTLAPPMTLTQLLAFALTPTLIASLEPEPCPPTLPPASPITLALCLCPCLCTKPCLHPCCLSLIPLTPNSRPHPWYTPKLRLLFQPSPVLRVHFPLVLPSTLRPLPLPLPLALRPCPSPSAPAPLPPPLPLARRSDIARAASCRALIPNNCGAARACYG